MTPSLKIFLVFLLLAGTLAPAQSHAYRKRHRAPAKPVAPAQPVTPLRFEDVAAKAELEKFRELKANQPTEGGMASGRIIK